MRRMTPEGRGPNICLDIDVLNSIYVYIYRQTIDKREAPLFTDHFAYEMEFIRVCFGGVTNGNAEG